MGSMIIDKQIVDEIDSVTKLLDDIIQGDIIKPAIQKSENKLRFIVARKWNSWYPSYFCVEGGCYAIITRDIERDLEKNKGAIVIDPGFKFLDIMRNRYNIEPHELRNILISHYHPDHTMGLPELLTLTNEIGYPCSYYFNKTSYDTFKSFQGKNNRILEMTSNQFIKLAEYNPFKSDNDFKELIFVETLKTFHREIGNKHNSLGFVFHILSGDSKQEIAILGDTDGNENYIDSYIDHLKNARIIVLHLGSYSDKGYADGHKHLYRNGLINILNCISCLKNGHIRKQGRIVNCIKLGLTDYNEESGNVSRRSDSTCRFIQNNYFDKLELIIISELGLEMASVSELIKSFSDLKWFNDLYPLFLFCKFYKDSAASVQRQIFSTQTIKFMHDINKINLNDQPLSKLFSLYNSFIYFYIYIFSLNLRKEFCGFERLIGDLTVSFKKIPPDLRKFKDLDDSYKTSLKSNIKYFGEFEKELDELLIELLSNVRLDEITSSEIECFDYLDLLNIIRDFSENILQSITEIRERLNQMRSMKKNYLDLISRRTHDLKQLGQFFNSTNLIENNYIDDLNIYYSDYSYKFDAVVCFISFELWESAGRLIDLISGGALNPEDKSVRANRGFLGILNEYGINGLKIMISNNGFELNLAGDLEIRAFPYDRWIPIKEAMQVIGANGNYKIKSLKELRLEKLSELEKPLDGLPDL
jgi:phosphoribosyl 1,2-cyclic phosphodiesterase